MISLSLGDKTMHFLPFQNPNPTSSRANVNCFAQKNEVDSKIVCLATIGLECKERKYVPKECRASVATMRKERKRMNEGHDGEQTNGYLPRL